jgi:hypothetical protein
MYGLLRFTTGFREELDKFIEATEKHAATLTKNNDTIICPCIDCKNLMAFSDVYTITSHLIMRGFVPDYTVWIHHGETMVVDGDGDDQEGNAQTLPYLSQFSDELGSQMDRALAMNKVVSLGNQFKPTDRFGLFGSRKLWFLEINTGSVIHPTKNRRIRCRFVWVRFSVSPNKPKHHRQTRRLGNGE